MINLLGLLFDGGLAILLVLTIGYCSRLSRRIRHMQDSRGELAEMITQFDQATGRAVASLAELQTVSKRITDALQLKIEKANFLADDLAFLIEKSSKLATQLEQAKSIAQAAAASTPRVLEKNAAFFPTPAKPKPVTFIPPQPQANDTPSSVKSAASLEALLSRLASSPGTASSETMTAVKPSPPQASPPRTDAERQLLEALRGR